MNNDLTSTGIAEPGVETKTDTDVVAQEPRVSRNGFEKKREDTEHNSQGPPKSTVREYFESLVVTFIMALFGMTFIVQAVKVPTGSMQNTIVVGDHLLVNKFIFAPGASLPLLPQREIGRGDIVVFKYPGNPHNPEGDKKPDNLPYKTNYVKRVVGLPGDTIEIRGVQVLINGKVLPEHIIEGRNLDEKAPLETNETAPRAAGDAYSIYYYPSSLKSASKGEETDASLQGNYAVNGKPFKIPADSYFVMGDNRDNSTDSRAWGVVPRELIVGRAMFVYWSYDESAHTAGNFLLDFFRNTRWERTGTMVK